MKSLECLEFGVPRVFKGSGVNQVNLTMIYQAWYKDGSEKNQPVLGYHYI